MNTRDLKNKGRLLFPGDLSEHGSILVWLLLTTFLLLLMLGGTWKIVTKAQTQVADQARADICAVLKIQTRKQVLQKLVETNALIQTTVTGVYMARGFKIISGPAGQILGAIGEAGLVRANQALTQWQNLQVQWLKGKELMACSQTPYSKTVCFCLIQPPLPDALVRKPVKFPDLSGAWRFKHSSRNLSKISCSCKGEKTTMELRGNPLLIDRGLSDVYLQ